MFAAGALVIQSGKLGKRHVFRCEITVGVHSEFSRTVSAIFIDSYDLAVADVRDRVG